LTWRSWEPLGIVSIFENSMLVDCHLSSNKGMRKVKQSTTSKETVAPSTSATDVSASTIRGYASALNCFEPDARSIEFESLEVIPETLITEAFFASLCNYLYDLEHTTGTLLQYLSGAYNYFSSKYDLPLFKIDRDPITKAPAWYSKMRFRLQTNLKKKAIENGEKIQPNKAASCGRELLIDCSCTFKN
jgi:hypothetical protein